MFKRDWRLSYEDPIDFQKGESLEVNIDKVLTSILKPH